MKMLSAIFAFLTGGGIRLLPEIMSLLNKFFDNSHELQMTKLQIELEQLKQAGAQAAAQQQIDAQEVIKMLEAQQGALVGQMQKVGIWIVDVLNFLVRPLATYYFLLLYGLAKGALCWIAIQNGMTIAGALSNLWAAYDQETLTSILGFWFVGRVFDKMRHGK